MNDRQGYRGYIASRPVRGERTPQKVQNLVNRDHARRHGLLYKLSATEYAMPACYMMLESVLGELASLEGIICYSMFMLPERPERRMSIYDRVLGQGGVLRAALEDLAVETAADIPRLEDIFLVDRFAARSFQEVADGLC